LEAAATDRSGFDSLALLSWRTMWLWSHRRLESGWIERSRFDSSVLRLIRRVKWLWSHRRLLTGWARERGVRLPRPPLCLAGRMPSHAF